MNRLAFPIPVSSFRLNDAFFAPRVETVRQFMLPYQWEVLNDRMPDTEPSYAMSNFRIAAGLAQGEHKGMVFQDSDLYKWLEAVSFALMTKKDAALEACADEAISILEKAQRPDGYLNTYYQLVAPDRRFTNLQDNHELYCAGHLFEAAAAHKQATGCDRLLNIALKFADLIDGTFGPEEGKLKGYPGHQVIEMGLIKLYRLTGEARYLNLAKFFIDERGKSPLYFEEEGKLDGNRRFTWANTFMRYQYYQAGKPVRDQHVAEGHAVRALYLYAGMVDVALETGDAGLWEACVRLWDNVTRKQMYITGAVGQSEIGESFTFDYDLPNDTAYAETCAQLALCFFAQRMLMNDMDSRYADELERAIYNGALSGMSLDGTRFFYVNPLEVVPKACRENDLLQHVKYERPTWFACACCPPNLARTLGSIGSYAYSSKGAALYAHLYVGGDLAVDLDGRKVELKVTTDYPWSGTIKVDVKTAGEYSLNFRIPGWCADWTATLNGQPVSPALEKGYAQFARQWAAGDSVELRFDMPATTVRANPHVSEDIGKLAVMRGPLVYCLEEVDNGPELHRIAMRHDAQFDARFEPELMGGMTILTCDGCSISGEGFESGALYAPAAGPLRCEPRQLKWIPYYAWTNRAPGEMRIWVLER
jgi:DUF1680 family protein